MGVIMRGAGLVLGGVLLAGPAAAPALGVGPDAELPAPGIEVPVTGVDVRAPNVDLRAPSVDVDVSEETPSAPGMSSRATVTARVSVATPDVPSPAVPRVQAPKPDRVPGAPLPDPEVARQRVPGALPELQTAPDGARVAAAVPATGDATPAERGGAAPVPVGPPVAPAPDGAQVDASDGSVAGSPDAAPGSPGGVAASPERTPSPLPPPPEGVVEAMSETATAAAKGVALPLTLVAVVVAFLAVQSRIDGKDPKLQEAPMSSDRHLFFPVTGTQAAR